MTDKTDAPSAPAEDLAIADAATDLALQFLGERGSAPPVAFMQVAEEVMIVPCTHPINGPESKRSYVNMLRFLSIEHGSSRTAIAMETWTMQSRDPKDQALLEEIHARGGSISEHPAAGESIFVIVESDAGVTTVIRDMRRDGPRLTLDDPRIDFDPAGGERHVRGIFSDFHVPTAMRDHPGVQLFAAGMRTITRTEMERIVPGDAPSAH